LPHCARLVGNLRLFRFHAQRLSRRLPPPVRPIGLTSSSTFRNFSPPLFHDFPPSSMALLSPLLARGDLPEGPRRRSADCSVFFRLVFSSFTNAQGFPLLGLWRGRCFDAENLPEGGKLSVEGDQSTAFSRLLPSTPQVSHGSESSPWFSQGSKSFRPSFLPRPGTFYCQSRRHPTLPGSFFDLHRASG